MILPDSPSYSTPRTESHAEKSVSENSEETPTAEFTVEPRVKPSKTGVSEECTSKGPVSVEEVDSSSTDKGSPGQADVDTSLPLQTILPSTAPPTTEEVPETQLEHEVGEPSAMDVDMAQPTLSTENPNLTSTHQDGPTLHVVATSVKTTYAPQVPENASPMVISAEAVDMDPLFDDPIILPTQIASSTIPVPQASNTGNGDVGIDEWISLLSGSSSKTSPLSARSSTLPGDNFTEKLNGLLEQLKGLFKYSFDDLYSNQEVRSKLIQIVKELQNSRRRLPPIQRGHVNTLYEFLEELTPKLPDLDGSILPYQQALSAKHALRDKLVLLRKKQSALVEKGTPHLARIPELEQNIARLKQELAATETQLQVAVKASCSEEIAAIDQELLNSTAEAQAILSKVETLEVSYVNAENTKMEFAATWEDIRRIPF